MPLRFAIAALCALSVLAGSGSGAERSQLGDFQLSLIREYGLAAYRECRLGVVAYAGRVAAELNCAYSGNDGRGRPIPPLHAREELSLDAGKRLMTLVEQSKLYDGGHIGGGSTASDASFEVLRLVSGRCTVVVVMSENPTFQTGSRKELLSALVTLERRLAASKER